MIFGKGKKKDTSKKPAKTREVSIELDNVIEDIPSEAIDEAVTGDALPEPSENSDTIPSEANLSEPITNEAPIDETSTNEVSLTAIETEAIEAEGTVSESMSSETLPVENKANLKKDKKTKKGKNSKNEIKEIDFEEYDVDYDELSQGVVATGNLEDSDVTDKAPSDNEFVVNSNPVVLNMGSSKDAPKTTVVERKKNARKATLHILVALLIILAVVGIIIVSETGVRNKIQSPLSINGKAVDSGSFSFMYHYLLMQNGVDVFAPDAQAILDGPSENPDFATTRDYFLDLTAQEMQIIELLYDDATSHGYHIGAEHYSMARAYIDWLNTKASEIGVPLNTYIMGVFGDQVTEQIILDTLAKKYFTEDYADNEKLEELQATEQQALEAYEANPNIYDLVSYKILRIRYEQRDDAFISTAHMRANEIIEEMGHDPSMFELVASEYFTGDDQTRLLTPDSTLVADARYSDFEHTEFRDWLFEEGRVSGDTMIFEDEDGFPIILCFVSRQQQLTPLRNVRIASINIDTDGSGYGLPVSEAQALAQEIYDYVDSETSMLEVENLYTDYILVGSLSVTQSADTYPDEFAGELNSWIFDPARNSGDTAFLETEDCFYVVYFVEESDKPEWYDRVNSFIRMNNYQAFMNEMLTEYTYEFNVAGLEDIQDVP